MNKQQIDSEGRSHDPLEDPNYMSPTMLSYFRQKLSLWRDSIVNLERSTLLSLLEFPNREPDHVDQGTTEELHFSQFAYMEHEDDLLKQINHAIERIDSGEYGYCEETGEEIGVKRLEVYPIARYSKLAQEAKEKGKPILLKVN